MGRAGARDPGQACPRADAGRGCARTSQCVKQSERGVECVNCVRETPRGTSMWGMETLGRTLDWSVHLESCHKEIQHPHCLLKGSSGSSLTHTLNSV